MISRHHTEVGSSSITASFWDNPEGCQRREVFTVGRTLGRAHDHTFFLKGEMARCATVHWLMVCSQWIGWARKKHDWKIEEKDLWGRRVWRDLSKESKAAKVFVSHVDVIKGLWGAKEVSRVYVRSR